MKKRLLFVVAMVFATVTQAQQQLATLNHNDSITVYYGINALQQAHAAAVNGDIITLSSGVFDPVTITKAITVRGAGAWTDSLGHQTTIRSSLTINVPNDSIHHLVIEGLYFLYGVYVQSAYNPQFLKCNGTFQCDQINAMMRNAMFVNCDLANWRNNADNGWCAQGTQFVNSVIRASSRYDSPDVFINCVLQQDPTQGNMLNRMFQDCILYFPYTNSYCPTQNSSTAFNCIFIQTLTASSYCANLFNGHQGHTLWNKRGWETVFKTTGFYELLDTIAATCLGNDGTQVGIYGGPMPFNMRVTNPVIRSINVGQRSTADGKLAVDIEVVSDEE